MDLNRIPQTSPEIFNSSVTMSNLPESRIQHLKTAFVVYNHADLDKAKEFLIEFGLQVAFEKPGQEIYFKGYGTEPYVYVARKASKASFGGGRVRGRLSCRARKSAENLWRKCSYSTERASWRWSAGDIDGSIWP